MASAQEAEQIIQSLGGPSTPLGRYVEQSAKKLLYELLRYIDGRTFVTAKEEKEIPFLTFSVYRDRIIADYNSDALTKEDLHAICQPVDEEQNKAANFRKIVAATKRTHIQSGNFSFEFQHNIFGVGNNDIMRPVWVTPAQTVPDNVTRVTTYLHDQGSKTEIQNLRNIIVSQLEGLEQESILFLESIQLLEVEFRYDDEMFRYRHFEKQIIDEYRVSVKSTTVKGFQKHTCTQLYHVAKPSSDRLPTSNIILAFPLTKDFKVELDNKAKKLFNFYALKTSRFGFHIHADFADDYEHGTIAETPFNRDIQHKAADLFIEAILQFSEHPTLKYHWPLFLTSRVTEWDPFWSEFDKDVRSWISYNPVLVTQHVKQWRLISHLYEIDPDTLDEFDDPVLDNEINDPFLSRQYPRAVTDILTGYGLATTMPDAQCLDLLEIFLSSRVCEARILCPDMQWYADFGQIISRLLNNPDYSEKIRSLQFLETKSGDVVSPVSTESQPIYFPTTKNIEISAGVGLRIIYSHGNGLLYFPKALYERLGVKEASVAQARKLVLKAFSKSELFTQTRIKDYLRFLYLTHRFVSPLSQRASNSQCDEMYRAVKVITKDEKIKSVSDNTIYLPGTEHPYTPESLLGIGKLELSAPINYLHPDLLEDEPKHTGWCLMSWKTWLCDFLGVKERLSLFEPCPEQASTRRSSWSAPEEKVCFSETCRYILVNRPHRFLGLLQHLWGFEGGRVSENPTLLSEIQGLPAGSLCGLDRSLALCETWLPLQDLTDFVKRYMIYPDKFPFLNLEEGNNMSQALTTKWGFLSEHLGVKRDFGMDFLLAILDSIMEPSKTLLSSQASKVFDLYISIGTKFLSCNDGERQRVMEFFNKSGILYTYEGFAWTSISKCRWAGPIGMGYLFYLEKGWQNRVQDEKKMSELSYFFREVLGVRDVTAGDLVEELRVLLEKDYHHAALVKHGLGDGTCLPPVHALVTDIYKYLDKEITSLTEIRNAFDDRRVIRIRVGDKSRWRSTETCFWSESEVTPIECSLKESYPDLKHFFLDKLGVRTSSYDKLVNFTSTDIEEAKECLLCFMEEAKFFHGYPPEPLQKAKIFPVEHPTSKGQPPRPAELCSLDTEFFISDREYLRKSLQSHIKMLSFDATEVRRLQPLFSWLSMEDRYLSLHVKEKLVIDPPSNCIPWKPTFIQSPLSNKAYQICRVAETFQRYGCHGDALSLYQRLQTMRIAKVDFMWTDLLVVQNGQTFRSKSLQKAFTFVSDHYGELLIFVNYDDSNEQLCFFSLLPRKLQDWLTSCRKKDNSVSDKITIALTSIFASDVDILDDILDDQGMAQLPFENLDKVQSEPYTGAQQPRVDQDKALTLPVRER